MAETVQGSANLAVKGAAIEGEAVLSGPLQGIFVNGQTSVSPAFRLTARTLHLEEDYAEIGTTGQGTVSIGTERQTDRSDYADVVISGQEVRPELEALVFPFGQMNVTALTRCAEITAPNEEYEEYVPWVRSPPERDIYQVSLETAADYTVCSSTFLRVEGDFLFAMWGWSAEMTHREGSRQLESGNLELEGAPPAVAMAGVNELRENFLFVTQGVLEFEALGSGVSIYGGPGTSLAVDGSLVLKGATGTIPLSTGDVRLEDDLASLTGTLTGTFTGRPSASLLSLDLFGQLANIVAPGATIVQVEPASSPFWTIMARIGLTVLAAGLVTYFVPALHYQAASRQSQLYASLPVFSLRHRRAVGYWIWASWLAAHGLPRLALALAGRSARLYQLLPEPHHLRASILKTLGRELDAMAEHDVLSIILTDADDRVGNACEAASILIARGEEEKARGWLTRIVNDLGPNVDASTLARLESVCLRLGMRPGQGGDRPGFT